MYEHAHLEWFPPLWVDCWWWSLRGRAWWLTTYRQINVNFEAVVRNSLSIKKVKYFNWHLSMVTKQTVPKTAWNVVSYSLANTIPHMRSKLPSMADELTRYNIQKNVLVCSTYNTPSRSLYHICKKFKDKAKTSCGQKHKVLTK